MAWQEMFFLSQILNMKYMGKYF